MSFWLKCRQCRYFLGSVLLAVFLSALLPSLACEAQAERVIRVGYYPMNHYHAQDATGNVVGYEVDYLARIAEQTGWTYEFVEADSWAHALEMLENNQVDLVSPAQISEQRLARYGFSALPIGKGYGAIITLQTNDIAYEDFSAFAQMTFGIESGVSYNELFAEYAAESGFTPKKIKTYTNSDALIAALNTGEIDAMAVNIMRMEDHMKLLGKFGSTSYYFMFRKGDVQLENELNVALYRIDIASPAYQDDLNKHYFPDYSKEYITTAEAAYIQTLPTLRIGCPTEQDPLSYLSADTGEVAGITRDILELVAHNTGLTFEYVAIPSGDITYDDLRALELDLVACVEKNSTNIHAPGMQLTSSYLSSAKVVVGRRGVSYDRNHPLTVAISTGSQTIIGILEAEYDQFTIVRYPDSRSCLQAIVNHEADLVIQNQYVLQPLLAKPQFSELAVIPAEGIADELCLSLMVYKNGKGIPDPMLSDRRLLTILNKGINNVTSEETSAIIIANTTNRPYSFEVKDFIYQYRTTVGIFCILLLVLGGGLFYIWRLRQKSYYLLRSSEIKLRNITNNINGGVVVLLPDQGMKIIYANEGFLHLLQYPIDDYTEVMSTSYVMYVHDDDVAVINDLLQHNYTEAEKISLRIRIHCKDGHYIPTRFNGTIARNHNGELEMYCVIMDISQEVDMLERLDLEQRKLNLIVEKANEIIYEVDMEKNEAQTSEAFQRILGWDLAGEYTLDTATDKWQIHHQDVALLQAMFYASLKEEQDATCKVRLLTREGGYRWFAISQYAMCGSHNELSLILGKLVDIDEQIKEKQQLEKQAQTDAMTGLYNKEAFLKLAAQYLESSRDPSAALMFLDLDGFKAVNDQLGHMTGDQAILDVAKKLQIIFSSYDLLARFGGDEFCILVKEIPQETLEDKLAWAIDKLSQTYTVGEDTVIVTASIGVAYTTDCGFDLDNLLKYADEALYTVKAQGKNHYKIYHKDEQLQNDKRSQD